MRRRRGLFLSLCAAALFTIAAASGGLYEGIAGYHIANPDERSPKRTEMGQKDDRLLAAYEDGIVYVGLAFSDAESHQVWTSLNFEELSSSERARLLTAEITATIYPGRHSVSRSEIPEGGGVELEGKIYQHYIEDFEREPPRIIYSASTTLADSQSARDFRNALVVVEFTFRDESVWRIAGQFRR